MNSRTLDGRFDNSSAHLFQRVAGLLFLASAVIAAVCVVSIGIARGAGHTYVYAFDGGMLGSNNAEDAADVLTDAVVGPYQVSHERNSHSRSPAHYLQVEYRNYHKFQLPPLREEVVAAYFELECPITAVGSCYEDDGADYPAFVVLYPVASDPGTYGFDFASGVGRAFSDSVYADLGSGKAYGMQWVSAADEGSLITIELGKTALNEINREAPGLFAIGGRLWLSGSGSIQVPDVLPETVFASTGSTPIDPRVDLPYIRRLVLVHDPLANPGDEPSFVHIAGIATGGIVRVRVDGVLLSYATSPGDNATKVMTELVRRINLNPMLSDLEVSAMLLDNQLVTDGVISKVVVKDDGLSLLQPTTGPPSW